MSKNYLRGKGDILTPKTISPKVFKFLKRHADNMPDHERLVVLSFSEFSFKDFVPMTPDGYNGGVKLPSHFIVPCIRFVVTRRFHFLGSLFICEEYFNRNAEKFAKDLSFCMKLYIRALENINLKVVATISPLTTLFHRAVEMLTEVTLVNYDGPLVYSLDGNEEIIHIHDPTYIRNGYVILFMACNIKITHNNKHFIATKDDINNIVRTDTNLPLIVAAAYTNQRYLKEISYSCFNEEISLAVRKLIKQDILSSQALGTSLYINMCIKYIHKLYGLNNEKCEVFDINKVNDCIEAMRKIQPLFTEDERINEQQDVAGALSPAHSRIQNKPNRNLYAFGLLAKDEECCDSLRKKNVDETTVPSTPSVSIDCPSSSRSNNRKKNRRERRQSQAIETSIQKNENNNKEAVSSDPADDLLLIQQNVPFEDKLTSACDPHPEQKFPTTNALHEDHTTKAAQNTNAKKSIPPINYSKYQKGRKKAGTRGKERSVLSPVPKWTGNIGPNPYAQVIKDIKNTGQAHSNLNENIRKYKNVSKSNRGPVRKINLDDESNKENIAGNFIANISGERANKAVEKIHNTERNNAAKNLPYSLSDPDNSTEYQFEQRFRQSTGENISHDKTGDTCNYSEELLSKETASKLVDSYLTKEQVRDLMKANSSDSTPKFDSFLQHLKERNSQYTSMINKNRPSPGTSQGDLVKITMKGNDRVDIERVSADSVQPPPSDLFGMDHHDTPEIDVHTNRATDEMEVEIINPNVNLLVTDNLGNPLKINDSYPDKSGKGTGAIKKTKKKSRKKKKSGTSKESNLLGETSPQYGGNISPSESHLREFNIQGDCPITNYMNSDEDEARNTFSIPSIDDPFKVTPTTLKKFKELVLSNLNSSDNKDDDPSGINTEKTSELSLESDQTFRINQPASESEDYAENQPRGETETKIIEKPELTPTGETLNQFSCESLLNASTSVELNVEDGSSKSTSKSPRVLNEVSVEVRPTARVTEFSSECDPLKTNKKDEPNIKSAITPDATLNQLSSDSSHNKTISAELPTQKNSPNISGMSTEDNEASPETLEKDSVEVSPTCFVKGSEFMSGSDSLGIDNKDKSSEEADAVSAEMPDTNLMMEPSKSYSCDSSHDLSTSVGLNIQDSSSKTSGVSTEDKKDMNEKTTLALEKSPMRRSPSDSSRASEFPTSYDPFGTNQKGELKRKTESPDPSSMGETSNQYSMKLNIQNSPPKGSGISTGAKKKTYTRSPKDMAKSSVGIIPTGKKRGSELISDYEPPKTSKKTEHARETGAQSLLDLSIMGSTSTPYPFSTSPSKELSSKQSINNRLNDTINTLHSLDLDTFGSKNDIWTFSNNDLLTDHGLKQKTDVGASTSELETNIREINLDTGSNIEIPDIFGAVQIPRVKLPTSKDVKTEGHIKLSPIKTSESEEDYEVIDDSGKNVEIKIRPSKDINPFVNESPELFPEYDSEDDDAGEVSENVRRILRELAEKEEEREKNLREKDSSSKKSPSASKESGARRGFIKKEIFSEGEHLRTIFHREKTEESVPTPTNVIKNSENICDKSKIASTKASYNETLGIKSDQELAKIKDEEYKRIANRISETITKFFKLYDLPDSDDEYSIRIFQASLNYVYHMRMAYHIADIFTKQKVVEDSFNKLCWSVVGNNAQSANILHEMKELMPVLQDIVYPEQTSTDSTVENMLNQHVNETIPSTSSQTNMFESAREKFVREDVKHLYINNMRGIERLFKRLGAQKLFLELSPELFTTEHVEQVMNHIQVHHYQMQSFRADIRCLPFDLYECFESLKPCGSTLILEE